MTPGTRTPKNCVKCGSRFETVKPPRGPTPSVCESCIPVPRERSRQLVREFQERKCGKFTIPSRICEQCGACFTRLRGRAFCSAQCREAATSLRASERWKAANPILMEMRCCAACGKEFAVSKRFKKSFCSRRCRSKSHWRKANHVRRARLRRAAVEDFDPIEVLERDGWRCHLCGISTPRRLRGSTKPNAPELDHIVPLALGGSHTRANTACSCRRCNGSKGAKRITGQPSLLAAGHG